MISYHTLMFMPNAFLILTLEERQSDYYFFFTRSGASDSLPEVSSLYWII